MADKSAPTHKGFIPRGKEYCDTPGTSCCYGPDDICVNCRRPKGWRLSFKTDSFSEGRRTWPIKI